LIEKLRDSKGAAHTEALAAAIAQLGGAAKTKARDALAQRLTRMTASTLRDKLQDESPEIRRAAALACAMKEDQQHVKDLIPLLGDSESLVSRAARVALKTLTTQDFGPQADASPTERAKAIAQWKDWLAKRTGSPAEGEPATDNPAKDWELLPGTWTVVSLQRGGKPLPRKSWPGLFVKFEKVGPQLTFAFVGQETPATCTLNPLRDPKEIDLVTEGRETSRAIYKLEGDVLTVCGVPEGEERPKTFATKAGTMQVLFVLKRHNP
jgi:uncharacterized protein (TIGR03067 family)